MRSAPYLQIISKSQKRQPPIYILSDILKKTYSYLLLVFVFIFALWDQTANSFNPQNDNIKSAFQSDDNYFKAIELSVPIDTMVFQLPYIPFPENPPAVNMGDYDHLRGYLHTKNIRWSYPTMKGREQDIWNRNISTESVSVMIDSITAKGFKGIYINRNGYIDNAKEIETQIQAILQIKPLENDDHSLAFYSMVKH